VYQQRIDTVESVWAEMARLDLLALFRALDRMDLSPAEIPQRLIRQLFELDADCADSAESLPHPTTR